MAKKDKEQTDKQSKTQKRQKKIYNKQTNAHKQKKAREQTDKQTKTQKRKKR